MEDHRSEEGARTEDPLAREFLAGDPYAVRQVRGLVKRVVRFRGYYIPSYERADIVQEVMLEVWKSIAATGAIVPRSFEAVVRSIAYRNCVDWIRRNRAARELRDLPRPAPHRPDLVYLEAEQRRLGPLVLERLRPPCRELFHLHAALELSYQQISERVGRSEGALRTQMSLCLKEAREILRQIQAGAAHGAGRRASLR